MSIDHYRRDNGYYDEEAIMQAGGMDARSAAFSDIFGETVTELAPDFQALLDEARHRNAEMYRAARRVHDERVSQVLCKRDRWSDADWSVLIKAGLAHVDGDDDDWCYVLNQSAPHLLYADQAGIDG